MVPLTSHGAAGDSLGRETGDTEAYRIIWVARDLYRSSIPNLSVMGKDIGNMTSMERLDKLV